MSVDYVGWAHGIYEEFFATTDGVPVPGYAYEGCYINYADNDVADPAHNRSRAPWPLLYYRGNYTRLQENALPASVNSSASSSTTSSTRP